MAMWGRGKTDGEEDAKDVEVDDEEEEGSEVKEEDMQTNGRERRRQDGRKYSAEDVRE